jgi:cytochrome c5
VPEVKKKIAQWHAALAAAILVAACSGHGAPPAETITLEPAPAQIAYAERASPSDATLAAIYERSCKACHAVNGMGAPLTGHADAWTLRSGQRSMNELVANVRNGLNAMPAMGYCPDCSDEDFSALIQFMSTEG